MNEFEQTIMLLIAHAGEAKNHCYKALELARQGLLEEAQESIRKADACLKEIHHVHGGLLANEHLPSDPRSLLLLMHAEDIYMTTMTERELVKHLIFLCSPRITNLRCGPSPALNSNDGRVEKEDRV